MADKFRRKKEPKHIRLYASITGSEAWRHLSGNAIKVLLALVARDDGTRNGNISFSVREAAEAANLSPHTAKRCLQELVELGFIRCTQKGAFSRKVSHASLWRYTWAAWPDGKQGPTRDFEKWKPDENTRGQVLHATEAVSALNVETPADPVADFATDEMETPLVSANPSNAKTSTLIIYQGNPDTGLETQQRKQANSCTRAELGDLRQWALAHLQRHEPGEQSRLAKAVPIPAGTLSKFINGGNLPVQYREPLADAVAVF